MYKFGLSEQTLEKILNYLKTVSGLKTVKIYGSRARGDYYRGADIDLAVFTDDPYKAAKLKYDLYELSTPYKFNLTDYNTLTNVELKKEIDKDGIIIYDSTEN